MDAQEFMERVQQYFEGARDYKGYNKSQLAVIYEYIDKYSSSQLEKTFIAITQKCTFLPKLNKIIECSPVSLLGSTSAGVGNEVLEFEKQTTCVKAFFKHVAPLMRQAVSDLSAWPKVRIALKAHCLTVATESEKKWVNDYIEDCTRIPIERKHFIEQVAEQRLKDRSERLSGVISVPDDEPSTEHRPAVTQLF